METEKNKIFVYVFQIGPPHSKVFTVVCTLGTDGEIKSEGQGPTKQAAKKVASELMIAKLSEMPFSMKSSDVTSLKAIQRGLFKQKKKPGAPVVKDLQKQSVSSISRLIQIAHIRKYKEPEFTVIDSTISSLPDDPVSLKLMSERERRSLRKKKPSFTIEVSVGPYSCNGTGPNKKAAKKAAADAALMEMGYEVTTETTASEENNGANDKSEKKGKVRMNNRGSKSKDNSKSTISARQIVPGIIVLSSENKSKGELNLHLTSTSAYNAYFI
jgi:double-stranded RNA-binding protein Staufen